jgi:hypothetical protein
MRLELGMDLITLAASKEMFSKRMLNKRDISF